MWLPRVVRDDPVRFLELAERQSGVLNRAQLLRLGVDRNVVARAVRGGRWQVRYGRAVVLHAGPLTANQVRWCALLASGPDAVLAGPSAAEAGGLVGYGSRHLHLAMLGRAWGRSLDDDPLLPRVIVHRPRGLTLHDRHPTAAPPRVRTPVAVRDAALWAPDPDRAVAIVAAAVQQRLVRPHQVREAMDRVQRSRHRRVVLLTLGDIEGGSHSLAELDAVRLCRAARLPVPDRQEVRVEQGGRRRYLDLEWRRYELCAEVDGGLHVHARGWWDDMHRQNELVLDGRTTVLRFPAMVLRLHPERFVDQVRRALLARGWRP